MGTPENQRWLSCAKRILLVRVRSRIHEVGIQAWVLGVWSRYREFGMMWPFDLWLRGLAFLVKDFGCWVQVQVSLNPNP